MKEILIVTPPDRPGTLAGVAECLAARGVNIEDIDATDDHEHGIIRLRARPYDAALHALSEAGYQAVSEEVLLIRLKDEPGSVARIAARFRQPPVNINSLRILSRSRGWAMVVLSTDDNAAARQLLSDCVV